MRISKFLPVVCAMAVGGGICAVHAQDNAAQAAARAAMMEKMNELEGGQSAQPQNQTPPSVKTNAVVEQPTAPAPAPAFVAPAPAPVATNAVAEQPPVAPAATNAVVEQPAMPSAPATNTVTEQPAPPAPATTNAVAEQPAPAPMVTNAAAAEPPPIVVTTNGATVAPTANIVVTPAETKPAPPSSTPANKSGMGFQPIEAPPLPISSAKEAQLQALLEKYKADQITPEQYQAQRAKILADP